MSRPEHIAPPDIYYNEDEAKKYATNSRMIEIQSALSRRAIELLNLPEGSSHLLDLGCGSGLSGEVLTELGHSWVGVDISQAMLGVAVAREVTGDLIFLDMGQGLPFRPASFDGAISISAIQWLCNADKREYIPQKRLYKFFSSLYLALVSGARAVFQLYAENPDQMKMITTAAIKAGFSGGLVIDYPNSTKAKKMFLCLFAGEPHKYKIPKGLEAEHENTSNSMAVDDGDNKSQLGVPFPTPSQQTALFTASSASVSKEKKGKKKREPVKSRNWILKKKETMRKQGKDVSSGSKKYTGRKRRPKF